MVDVLVELRARAPDEGPVSGAEHVELELTQPAERAHIGRERALAGRDENAPLAEHGVTCEADPLQEEADTVGRVAGGGEGGEGARRLARARGMHGHA